LSNAKLIIKTDQLGTDHFRSKFRLRKGATDIDVSDYMPFDQSLLAIVSAETTNSAGTITNATDYTITHFTLSGSGLSFDVQGFGIWKSSSLVYGGKTIMADPFPSSIMVSALDGVGFARGAELTFHGSVAITGRKIEVVTNQLPTVTLIRPTDGQTNTVGQNVIFNANASDIDGRPATVEFYQDGNKLGESQAGSASATVFFSFAWTNATPGTFHVYARAIDDDGAAGKFSATNTITINPAP
jgi:hypothetical protein